MKDDTISRAAALDALGERPIIWSDNDEYTLGERNQYDMDRLAIETVPSAKPEYERVSAENVAVSIAPTKLASAVWLYGTLTELEKAGYVICRKMT